MILKQQLEAQGATLFKWRSFMPLVILPVAVAAGLDSKTFADGHADLPGRLYDLSCVLVSFLGLALRALTVASAAPRTSGRNTREQRADSLNTTGAYSVVRNPLYVANFVVFLGLLMFVKEWWLIVIATLSYVMYYERIVLTEESYLVGKFGSLYLEWANETPAMIPDPRRWKKPARRLSVRKVLRSEYNGFYLIVTCFYIMEWCDRLLCFHENPARMTLAHAPGLIWTSFFVAGTLTFIALRSLKKYTGLLDSEQG